MALTPASVSAPQGMTMMMASVRHLFLLAQSEGSKIDLKDGGSADEALVLLPPTLFVITHRRATCEAKLGGAHGNTDTHRNRYRGPQSKNWGPRSTSVHLEAGWRQASTRVFRSAALFDHVQ